MIQKIKDFIFHELTQKAVIAAGSAAVAYLTNPVVMAKLAAIGITIDPTKLSPFIIAGITALLTVVVHYLQSKATSN